MIQNILLASVIVLAAIIIWLVYQLIRLKRRVDLVPEEGGVFETLQGLDTDLASVEEVVADLGPRVESLERRIPLALSRTGVVVYDAFDDIAGNLSRSIALLNERGDGVVISMLVGRAEARFFTKVVERGAGREILSPEEEAAIRQAMAG